MLGDPREGTILSILGRGAKKIFGILYKETKAQRILREKRFLGFFFPPKVSGKT